MNDPYQRAKEVVEREGPKVQQKTAPEPYWINANFFVLVFGEDIWLFSEEHPNLCRKITFKRFVGIIAAEDRRSAIVDAVLERHQPGVTIQ